MDGQGAKVASGERALFAAPVASLRAPLALPPASGAVPAGDIAALDTADTPLLAPVGRPARIFKWTRSQRPLWQLAGDAITAVAAAALLETERGAVFLLAPVLICAGAVGYFALPFEPEFSALFSGAAIATLIALAVRSRPLARCVLIAVLMVLAGMLAAKVETWRAATKVIGGEISTRLTGRVEVVEHRANGRIRLTLDVLSTARPTLRYQPDHVRVTARAVPDGVGPGSVVEGVVRLLPPLGPLRPDSYDFAFESYFDGIGANGFYLGASKLVASPVDPGMFTALSAMVERARNTLAARIRGHIGGAEGEIAAALVAGVRAGIPEEANEALRITGLAHVLSISGLHMALVAGVVIASLRAGFALFPGFASRHPVRKYAAVLALIALSLYLLISGAAVAAQRSYIMIAVMLIALLFDRAALTMRNLAISALIILVVAPHEAAGPSFQMSFAATAALIAAYAWWSNRRQDRPGSPPGDRSAARRVIRTAALYAVGLAATSLIAGAATGIFGAWHFQRVSPLGLVANLAAMPIVSLVVMPFAVVGMVLMPLDLDGWAFVVMGKGLSWMLAVTAWLAERSPLDAIGAIPAAAVLLLSLALVPLTVATTTAMRAFCLPLIAAGVFLIATRDLPQVYVSEDARLVGMRTGSGLLAVNRSRPNAFTVEDWSRAMMATGIEKPEKAVALGGLGIEAGARFSESADITLHGSDGPVDVASDIGSLVDPTGFICAGDLCLARHASGAVVAHAATMPAAEPACSVADVIVIADPTAANPCPHSDAMVITARSLALGGSVEIAFDASGKPQIRHAIGETLCPWHDHRRFSRTARGMPPYVRRPKPTTNTSGSAQPADPAP